MLYLLLAANVRYCNLICYCCLRCLTCLLKLHLLVGTNQMKMVVPVTNYRKVPNAVNNKDRLQINDFVVALSMPIVRSILNYYWLICCCR